MIINAATFTINIEPIINTLSISGMGGGAGRGRGKQPRTSPKPTPPGTQNPPAQPKPAPQPRPAPRPRPINPQPRQPKAPPRQPVPPPGRLESFFGLSKYANNATKFRTSLNITRGIGGIILGKGMSAMPLLMGMKVMAAIGVIGAVNYDLRQSIRQRKEIDKMGLSGPVAELADKGIVSGRWLSSLANGDVSQASNDLNNYFDRLRSQAVSDSSRNTGGNGPDYLLSTASIAATIAEDVVSSTPVVRDFANIFQEMGAGVMAIFNALGITDADASTWSLAQRQEIFDSYMVQDALVERAKVLRAHNRQMLDADTAVGSGPHSFGRTEFVGGVPWFLTKNNKELEMLTKRINDIAADGVDSGRDGTQ